MENYGTQLFDLPLNNDTYKRSGLYYSGVLPQGVGVDYDPDGNNCLWDCKLIGDTTVETRRYDSYYSELMPVHNFNGCLEVTEIINNANNVGHVYERYTDVTYNPSQKNIEYIRKGYLPASAQGKFKTNSGAIEWLPWMQVHDEVGAYPQILDLSYGMTTPGTYLTGAFVSAPAPQFRMVVEENFVLLNAAWWVITKSSGVWWGDWTDGPNHRVRLWDGTSTYSDADLLNLCKNAINNHSVVQFEVQHWYGAYSIRSAATLQNYNDELAIYVNGWGCDHIATANFTQYLGCSASWVIPR